MTAESSPQYVLLTGATGAIGGEIARGLLAMGKNVILAYRSESKGEKLLAALKKEYPGANLKTLRLDLADNHSLIEAANTLRDVRLEGVIHNAGVMNRYYSVLDNGVEATIGVNFMNTMRFTEMLLPLIEDGGAVVFTSSLTRFIPQYVNYSTPQVDEKRFSQLGTYGLSKRLITTYAAQLANTEQGRRLRVNCADPGVVDTGMISMQRWYDRLADVVFRPFIRSPRQGAIPALRAFAAKDSGHIYCRFVRHRLKPLMFD